MKVLFLQGGWDGHRPSEIVARFVVALREKGADCEVVTDLARLTEADWLRSFDLISPCWTMGSITPEQSAGLREAVRAGTGLAGVHGGMGDAFRGDTNYEWMVGGHFVGHPYVGEYIVHVVDAGHPAMKGLPAEFVYRSEQYYMLVDPAICVLADSEYTHEGGVCRMPVVWTKTWGLGRIFYSALGHEPSEFGRFPEVFAMSVRGLLWAARKPD